MQFRWADAISASEWKIYLAAMNALREGGVPFMLGGGFALATFTGRWRDTKDIDFYIHPEHREAAMAALKKAGFDDYFSRRPYDRKWIYRSIRKDVIVDVIWAMANQRAQVDEIWFERAGSVEVRGEHLRVVPMEEFLWCKLYIMQRDHCDWTDVFNLLYVAGPSLDWSHLFKRVEEDVPLLKAMLMVYGWLCPKAARKLPPALLRRLNLSREFPPHKPKRNHIRLFDSRGWFAALQPANKKMEV